MKIAYLIMTFKEPKQIERLIRKMSHTGNDFYIHVDKKIDITPFNYLEDLKHTKLIRTRLLVNWAGYSFTDASLECIKEILESGTTYDFINLMSSQDYPIQSNEHIYDFLSKNIGKSFLSYEAFGSEWWNGAKHRVELYHLTDFPFRGHYRLQQLINFLTPIRKFPLPYILYGGNRATWWTISPESAEYVVKFMEENPKVRRFCQFSWAPDEYIFPTLLLNSPLKDKVINDNLLYSDWSLGGPNPKLLVDDDLENIKSSGKFFARKFDINKSAGLLDKIDQVEPL